MAKMVVVMLKVNKITKDDAVDGEDDGDGDDCILYIFRIKHEYFFYIESYTF